MVYCSQCEGLIIAAVKAARAYHDLTGDLETAHIQHDSERLFEIKQRVAIALKNRDSALRSLNDHEHTHAKLAGS